MQGYNDIVLIAWSMGGQLAIDILLSKKIKIKALVLVNSTAKFSHSKKHPFGIKKRVIKDFAVGMKQNYLKEITAIKKLMLTKKETHKFELPFFLPDKKSSLATFFKLIKADYCKKLKKIKLPTLIIASKLDRICPFDSSRYLNQNIKGSKLITFFKAAHLPFYTEAILFNQEIKAFLQDVFSKESK